MYHHHTATITSSTVTFHFTPNTTYNNNSNSTFDRRCFISLIFGAPKQSQKETEHLNYIHQTVRKRLPKSGVSSCLVLLMLKETPLPCTKHE